MRPHVRNPFSKSLSLEVPISESTISSSISAPSSEPVSTCMPALSNQSAPALSPPESSAPAHFSAPIPSSAPAPPYSPYPICLAASSSMPAPSSVPVSSSVPVPTSLEDGEITSSNSQPNTTANETRDLVWAVYKAKPWCAPHKEVMKTWNGVAEDLNARGICNRDGQYIRRKILNLIEIHHDPDKKWKFFTTEEIKASLEGALERISYEWDKSEENKRIRTREKKRADEMRDREGEILKISAVSPLVRTSTVSLDSLRNSYKQQCIKKRRGRGKGSKLNRVTQKKKRIPSDSQQNEDSPSCCHTDALVEEVKTLRETVGKIETVLNRFLDTVEKN